MPVPEPATGLVISYDYLWQSEHDRGREEAVKGRPCAIILAVHQDEGDHIVIVAPITHTPPRHPREAVELPALTKRRLGLDDERSWIVATEVNRFSWPGPDLRTVPGHPGVFAYGSLPRQLILEVRGRIAELRRDKLFRVVPRDTNDNGPAG